MQVLVTISSALAIVCGAILFFGLSMWAIEDYILPAWNAVLAKLQSFARPGAKPRLKTRVEMVGIGGNLPPNRYKELRGWTCDVCGLKCEHMSSRDLLLAHGENHYSLVDKVSGRFLVLCVQCHVLHADSRSLEEEAKIDGRWARVEELRSRQLRGQA